MTSFTSQCMTKMSIEKDDYICSESQVGLHLFDDMIQVIETIQLMQVFYFIFYIF